MKKTLILSLNIFVSLFIISCGGSNKNSTSQNNTVSLANNDINRTIFYTPDTNTKESNITIKSKLADGIKEISGLINLDNQLWAHNDSGDEAKLYQINENNGNILKTITITNATNNDWEDISYDETHIYIGDFGNNNGNRTDLKIYKLLRSDLKTKTSISAEVINFKYSNQVDFTSNPNNNNFDCEAMITYQGKIYLFSKNWKNKKTHLYELESTAGTHIANYKSTFDTKGLVTGASLNKELGIVLLTTYSSTLNVNIWLLSNFSNSNFFNEESKQLTLTRTLQAQVEGITLKEDYKAYLSSEAFSNITYGISFNSSLYELDFAKEFE